MKTSEIRKEIKEKIEEVKEQIKESLSGLETKIKDLEVQNKKLTETTLRLERKVRKNNIAVFGVGINESDLTQAVCDIFINSLGVEIKTDDINDIYRIGNPRNNRAPIIVEFISYQKKLVILKNAKKLKGSNISITSDLCFEDRKDKKILIKHLKEARNKGVAAYVKGGKLYVSGEVYTVRDLEREIESEEEEVQELTYKDLQNTEISNRPNSAPSTPDPITRGKRQLEEEEGKENQNSKKKSKEEGSSSGKIKSIICD